jgi:hypothetical protein
MWGGECFSHIYTDGSYKEESSWGEMLLGTPRREAGGAVVLSDGHSWYHHIFVNIDVEVTDAGQVELICLLIANEMCRAQGTEVEVGSDCSNAIDILEGKHSDRFSNTIGGWRKWDGVRTRKIDAHPERHKRWGEWEDSDMGIYVADRVAGRFFGSHRSISAREWLIRISAQSKVAIELEDGTPFIGSVARRASMESMRQYCLERDGYREIAGEFEPKWEGANLAIAPTLLRRNGGFEDWVTMVKLGAGKRWDVSEHNPAECVLCGESFNSQRHAMMACMAMECHDAREAWKKNIMKIIRAAGINVKLEMEEYYRNVFQSLDGELAAVGTYTMRWVAKLNKGKLFNLTESKKMKELMITIAQGARGVMRVYTRACADKTRGKGIKKGYERELELRQLSINDFIGGPAKDNDAKIRKKKKEKAVLPARICTPPADIFLEIERGGIGLVRLDR